MCVFNLRGHVVLIVVFNSTTTNTHQCPQAPHIPWIPVVMAHILKE